MDSSQILLISGSASSSLKVEDGADMDNKKMIMMKKDGKIIELVFVKNLMSGNLSFGVFGLLTHDKIWLI